MNKVLDNMNFNKTLKETRYHGKRQLLYSFMKIRNITEKMIVTALGLSN